VKKKQNSLYWMFERHIDFEYDDTVLIKSVKDLNVGSEQVLTHSNGFRTQ
jgi:hypothetical protein